jgi:hypothetical protein
MVGIASPLQAWMQMFLFGKTIYITNVSECQISGLTQRTYVYIPCRIAPACALHRLLVLNAPPVSIQAIAHAQLLNCYQQPVNNTQ